MLRAREAGEAGVAKFLQIIYLKRSFSPSLKKCQLCVVNKNEIPAAFFAEKVPQDLKEKSFMRQREEKKAFS